MHSPAVTGAGYAVYAGDHRGHGATAADVGYFAVIVRRQLGETAAVRGDVLQSSVVQP